jgi:hypothetical protein
MNSVVAPAFGSVADSSRSNSPGAIALNSELSLPCPAPVAETLDQLAARLVVGRAIFDAQGLLASWQVAVQVDPKALARWQEILMQQIWLQSFLGCCFQLKGFTHSRTCTGEAFDLLLVRSQKFLALIIPSATSASEVLQLALWARQQLR